MRAFCPASLPAGINKDCLKFPASLDLAGLTDPNQVFDSLADVKNPAKWVELVQNLTMWVPSDLSSYEDTTPDPTINTTTKNKQLFVRPGVPSFKANLEGNACDFNSVLKNVGGGVYGVPMILEDQSVIMRDTGLGTFGFMQSRANGYTKGVPAPDVIEEAFPIQFNFTNYRQFKHRLIIPLDFDLADELAINSPIGYTIIAEDIPAAGVGNFFIAKNCAGGEAGFIIADFEIIASNVTTPVLATLVEAETGEYALTFEKGTAEPLVAEDWIEFRIKLEAVSIVSKVSNKFLFVQK